MKVTRAEKFRRYLEHIRLTRAKPAPVPAMTQGASRPLMRFGAARL